MRTFLATRRAKGLALAVLVLLVLLVGAFVYHAVREYQAKKALLQTPEAVDLSVPPPPAGDHDPTAVPSQNEAMGYINLCRRRPLTEAEIDRVCVLARDTHYDLTAMTAMAVLTSIDAPNQRDRIIALLCDNLKSPQSLVRMAAIASLGNMKAVDKAPLILPFLNSPTEKERESAESTLKKLGYKLKKQ